MVDRCLVSSSIENVHRNATNAVSREGRNNIMTR